MSKCGKWGGVENVNRLCAGMGHVVIESRVVTHLTANNAGRCLTAEGMAARQTVPPRHGTISL